MKHLSKKLKSILIDTAGVVLIVLAGLLGWLPGPGGIPLLIAGLGLLSVNHDWAKHWLLSVQKHGIKLSDKLFDGSKTTMVVVDIIGILLIAIAVLVILLLTGTVAKTVAVWLAIISIVLLLGNRKRLLRLLKKH